MRKVFIIAGVFLMIMGPFKVMAQQIPAVAPAVQDQGTDKKAKFEELKKFVDSLRDKEKPLNQQIKEESDKIKALRDQLKALREENKKAIDAKRTELGFPAPQAAPVPPVKPQEKK